MVFVRVAGTLSQHGVVPTIVDIGEVEMSIQVNDFRWEPGKNDAEYIKLLESSRDEWQKIAQKAIAKLKALSKAQEPEALDAQKQDSDVGCWYDITHNYTLEQVVSALKAQEPRVMTLEEVKMLDSDYYYLESMRSPGKELREIVGAYGLTCVTWPSITWARQTMGDSGYGKTWRCWTSRPDDATREAIPWMT